MLTSSQNLLTDTLAAYRLTRLVVEDRVPFGNIRQWIHDNSPDSLIAEWVQCPWCAGIWVATGVVLARAVTPRWWTPTATVLALSAATGLLATWENKQ